MSTVVLEAAARSETGKGVNRRLRSAGMVPAVVYGIGTEDVLNVALKPIDVVRILKSEMGANTLATLQVDGKEGPKVLIKDYQIHPVKRTLIHVDLLAVKDDQPVRVLVPVNYLGQSPLEKMGAKRRVLSRDVLVSCLPGDIPTAISYSMEESPNRLWCTHRSWNYLKPLCQRTSATSRLYRSERVEAEQPRWTRKKMVKRLKPLSN